MIRQVSVVEPKQQIGQSMSDQLEHGEQRIAELKTEDVAAIAVLRAVQCVPKNYHQTT
jgi:hypothetical protein